MIDTALQHLRCLSSMISVPKTVMTEAAIAVPIGSPGAIAVPRSGLRLRAWMLTAMLFLVPLLAYWPATFHDYGLRDDYSNLREAHEELGKVVKFCASHARPIYGWLLQATFRQTSSVQNLAMDAFFRGAAAGRHLAGELSRLANARLVVQYQPVFCGVACVGAVRAGDRRHGRSAGRTPQPHCWRSADFSRLRVRWPSGCAPASAAPWVSGAWPWASWW